MSPRTALLSIRRIGKGGWRRNAALLSAFGATMMAIGIVAELAQAPEAAAGTLTAMLGTAGESGSPKVGTVTWSEDFENGLSGTSLAAISTSPNTTRYTGANGIQYTADAAWLPSYNACNGWVTSYNVSSAPSTSADSRCNTWNGQWNTLRSAAQLLAQAQGITGTTAQQSNHALTTDTNGNNNVQVPGYVMKTVGEPIPVQPGRFYSVSAYFASIGCTAGSGILWEGQRFSLWIGGQEHVLSDGVNPCTDPTATRTTVNVATAGSTNYYVSHPYSSALLIPDGVTGVGMSLYSYATTGNGNDGAFDLPQITDVTPQVYQSFAPATVLAGQPTTLTFTITNTAELQEKAGWSLATNLPDGTQVAAKPNVQTSCGSPTVGAQAGDSTITVINGDLSAGQASCTVSVDVTASVAGTYANTDVTAFGLFINPDTAGQAPAPASLTAVKPASVSGGVWLDADNNGTWDADETAVTGASVTLTGTNNQGKVVTLTTASGTDGKYAFNELWASDPAGYIVTVTPPDGYDGFTKQGVSSNQTVNSNVIQTTGATAPIVLAEGQTVANINAGLIQMVRIGGVVWDDLNRNGVIDEGEPRIGGNAVKVTDSTGVQVTSTSTAADGSWSVSVPATVDSYTVSVTPVNGATFSQPGGNADVSRNSVVDSAGQAVVGPVRSGQSQTVNAGVYGVVDVAKTVSPITGSSLQTGQLITWILTFTNAGSIASAVDYTDDLTMVVDDVTVTMPAESTPAGLVIIPSPDGKSFSVAGTIAPGTQSAVMFTGVVKPMGSGDGVIENNLVPTENCVNGVCVVPPSVAFCQAAITCTVDYGLDTDGSEIAIDSAAAVAAGDTHKVTVTLKDAGGNIMMLDESVELALVLPPGLSYAKGQSGLVFDPVSGTYAVDVTAQVAGSYPVAVEVDGYLVGATVNANFAAGTPSTGPVTCPAGSPYTQGTGLTLSFDKVLTNGIASATALVTDQYCNPIPGVDVSFVLNPVSPASSHSAVLSSTGGITGDGLDGSTFGAVTTTISDAVIEQVVLSASIPAGPIYPAAGLVVTFVAADISSQNSTLTIDDPGAVPVGGTHRVTLALKDGDGNTVLSDESAEVLLVLTSGLEYAPGQTGLAFDPATGTYVADVTSLVAGSHPISALYAGDLIGQPDSVSANFAVGAPVLGPVTCPAGGPYTQGTGVSATPASVTADGSSAAVVTALVTDQYCNPVPGVDVSFALSAMTPATSQSAVLSSSGGVTGDGTNGSTPGAVTVLVTDDVAEQVAVTVVLPQAGSPAGKIDPATGVVVTFVAGAADPGKSVLAIDAQTAVAAGMTHTVTVTLKDAGGNTLMTNQSASLSLKLPDGLSYALDQTDLVFDKVTGKYSIDVTAQLAGSYPITAELDGLRIGAAVNANFQAGAVAPGPFTCSDGRPGSNLAISPASVEAGDPTGSTLTVLVTDANCNPVNNAPVTVQVDGSAVLDKAAAVLYSDDSGYVTVHVTDAKAEFVNVQAVSGAVAVDATKIVEFIPSAPVITGPIGTVVTDSPTITGTGSTPGNTITIFNEADVACSTRVQPDGTWACTPPPLGAETHIFTATETDGGNNTSAFSNPVTVIVDKTAPVITGPKGTVVDATPVISGSAPNGTTVTVTDGSGNPVPGCTGIEVSGGTWSCWPSSPLPAGSTTLTAVVDDGNGTTLAGAPIQVTVDKTTPMITSPSGTVVNATPTISGTGPNGATITVTDGSGIPVPGCTGVAISGGTWTCSPSNPLPPGANTLRPIAADGNGGALTGAQINLVVDTTAPVLTSPAAGTVVNVKPTISGNATNGTIVTVTDGGGSPVPGCLGIVVLGGAWSCTPSSPLPAGTSTLTPVASDGDGGSVPGAAIQVVVDTTLPVDSGPTGAGADTTPAVITGPSGTVLTGKPVIGGTGPSGTTVTVVDASGTPVPGCVGLVISGGAWTCTPNNALPDGTTKLTPVVDDGAGGTVIGNPVTVTIETVPAGIYRPVPNTTIVSDRPMISGPGIADGDTVTVTDGNGVPVPGCTGIVVEGGAWTCTPANPLPPGANTLRATETDMSGNAGTPSAPVTVNVDTTTPAIGSPAGGTTVVNATPVFSGSAAQGTTATVKDGNGTPVPGCENIAVTANAWTCTPNGKLPDGQNSFTVTVTDPSGNDATSASITVTVNVSPPAITSPAGGATLLGTTPSISGAAVADGDSVTVTDAKGAPVPGCADVPVVNGAWACTPTGLPAGVSLLTAVEKDLSGNTGTPSEAIRIMVDTSSNPAIATPKADTAVVSATPSISGTGVVDGDTVTVQTSGGVPVAGCEKIVVADGAWSCTPTAALPVGTTTLTPVEFDQFGSPGVAGPAVTVTIDVTAPTVDTPLVGTIVATNRPAMGGAASAEGGTVTVMDGDGAPVPGCEGIPVVDGKWTCTPIAPLASGDNRLTVTLTDPSGNSIVSAVVTVIVASGPPSVTTPAAGTTVVTASPSIGGTSPAGGTVTVIDEHGVPVPGCVDVLVTGGAWACVPTVGLTSSSHTLTAVATDLSGNKAASPAVPVVVDTSAPASPVDPPASAAPRVDTQFAQRRNGDDQQIVGHNFNPGEAVHAVVNSTPLDLGTKIADSDGRVVFNFTVPAGFELGTHTANLTGAVSGAVSVTFDVIEMPPPIRASTSGSIAPSHVTWAIAAGAILLGAALRVSRRMSTSRNELPGN